MTIVVSLLGRGRKLESEKDGIVNDIKMLRVQVSGNIIALQGTRTTALVEGVSAYANATTAWIHFVATADVVSMSWNALQVAVAAGWLVATGMQVRNFILSESGLASLRDMLSQLDTMKTQVESIWENLQAISDKLQEILDKAAS
eukprot:TRINITY_DN774_c0_g1_i1.p1 TRINITY_DN774_c0_g1~~TRINITY_DN774_c0_g1_i1.p1  ORF type:complete len:169 (-),score=48.53 TRINITY_DN774_c0_g1_i1:68-502(-)